MPRAAKNTGPGVIAPPAIKTAEIAIKGTSPYVQNKFTARAKEEMHRKQEEGSRAKKGQKREGKDFQLAFKESQHVTKAGWRGIPAPAFRNAMISACRLVGFQMTRAKLSVFVDADGFDADDGTPLVRITKGEPEYTEMAVRNETGVADLRARPMWAEGWEATVRVKYDADQFSESDVKNLLARAGLQVGIGAGRPDSRSSAGMGWGLFEIVE